MNIPIAMLVRTTTNRQPAMRWFGLWLRVCTAAGIGAMNCLGEGARGGMPRPRLGRLDASSVASFRAAVTESGFTSGGGGGDGGDGEAGAEAADVMPSEIWALWNQGDAGTS